MVWLGLELCIVIVYTTNLVNHDLLELITPEYNAFGFTKLWAISRSILLILRYSCWVYGPNMNIVQAITMIACKWGRTESRLSSGFSVDQSLLFTQDSVSPETVRVLTSQVF